jgi:hypothetical protein
MTREPCTRGAEEGAEVEHALLLVYYGFREGFLKASAKLQPVVETPTIAEAGHSVSVHIDREIEAESRKWRRPLTAD